MKEDNTLFNVLTRLGLVLTKYQAKQLGQIIKDEYLKTYKSLPPKKVVNLKDRFSKDIIRMVAVYPDEFVTKMHSLIQTYLNHTVRVKRLKN